MSTPEPKAPHPPLAYSIAQFIQDSGIGRTKTYQLINDGTLKTRRVGSRRLILGDSARAFFNQK